MNGPGLPGPFISNLHQFLGVPQMATVKRTGLNFMSIIRRPEFGALISAVFVYVFFAVFGGAEFMGVGGTSSTLNIAAELGLIALPVALVMIAGDLDLSVGSTMMATGVTMAVISGFFGAPTWVGFVAAIALGLFIGFINGIITTKTNLPSFVTTLAISFATTGLTFGIVRIATGTVSVAIEPEPWLKDSLGTLFFNNWEGAIFLFIFVSIVVSWVLYKTKYGNWIYAIGGDMVSAKATGIPVDKVRIALFMGSGLGSALLGIVQTAMYNSAQVGAGSGFVFNSIIAVVIGGVLLTGGYGSPVGVVLGCLTFAIVGQGIYYTGWESDWAMLFIGTLLLAAVLSNNTFRRLALGGGRKKTAKESK
jgi:simple sugar transport system permease protein